MQTAPHDRDGDGPDHRTAKRMSLLEHLQELRVRLRNAALLFGAATLVSSFFANDFFHFLARPVMRALTELGQRPVLIRTTPAEGFWVQVKLALVLGLVTALPLVFWELWKFVAPGLYRRERRLALAVTGATVACFLGGAVFGYALLSKTTHLFLLATGTEVPAADGELPTVLNLLSMSSVADFQITMLLGCGAAFELPVVLGLLGWLGLIQARGMWRFNKYALVLSAVGGAVLTPGGDVYTQALLAGPLYVLYNVSIGLVWLIERGRPRVEADSPLLLLVAAWPVVRRRLTALPARLRAAA